MTEQNNSFVELEEQLKKEDLQDGFTTESGEVAPLSEATEPQNTTGESADDVQTSEADLESLSEVFKEPDDKEQKRQSSKEGVLKKLRGKIESAVSQEEIEQIMEDIPPSQKWARELLQNELIEPPEDRDTLIDQKVDQKFQKVEFQKRFRELALGIPKKDFAVFRTEAIEVRKEYPNLKADDLVRLAKERSGITSSSKRAEITLSSRKSSPAAKDFTKVEDPMKLSDEDFDKWATSQERKVREVQVLS